MSVIPMADHHRSAQGAGRDVFEETRKRREPLRCGECGATLLEGRWTWEPAPEGAVEGRCPACHRIAVHYPAGEIVLAGPFFQGRRVEVLNLVRNVEREEKARHPLERIMEVREEAGQTRVTTTGVHLARWIGEALARAHDGKLEMKYGEGDRSVRVRWER